MYDLEEQEQIEALKQFWKQYGRLIIAAALAFVIGIGGVQGWKYYKRSQAEQASLLFDKLDEAVNKGDATEVRNVGGEILIKYPRTPYGPMAALIVAKTEHERGDLDAAAKQLAWAVEHADSEEVRMLSRLRLAGVRLDQKNYDDALKLLDAKRTDAFVPLYADMRGDVFVAQGKVAEARAAYKQAIEKSKATSSWRNVVQVKLDALGTK